MQTEARVGAITASDGSINPLRSGVSGALVTQATGKYREATQAGRIFVVANQGVVNSTAGFTSTYTGLCVYNPVGSGKNFAMLGFGYTAAIAVPTTAAVVGIMTGGNAEAAIEVIVPRNRLSGGPASAALVDDAVVFTADPVLEQVFCTFNKGALTAGVHHGSNWIDLDGSLIVTPGYHCSAYVSAVNAGTWMFSFMWEEYTP